LKLGFYALFAEKPVK